MSSSKKDDLKNEPLDKLPEPEPAKVMTGIFGAGMLNKPGDNKIPSCKYCLCLK